MLTFFALAGVIVSAVGIYRYYQKRKQELANTANQSTIDTIIADRYNLILKETGMKHPIDLEHAK